MEKENVVDCSVDPAIFAILQLVESNFIQLGELVNITVTSETAIDAVFATARSIVFPLDANGTVYTVSV
jgi:hypothetical protein